MQLPEQIRLNVFDWLAIILVAVGAINWGLVGIAGFIGTNLNVVNLVLGGIPVVENLVYLLVGLAGLYMVFIGYQLFAARDIEMRTPPEAEPAAK